MKKLKLTTGEYALVDDNTFALLMQYKWTQDRTRGGYVICTVDDVNERRMHRLIVGAKPGEVVDHIDGNPLNNQFSNLRICTPKENTRNRKLNKHSSSGYKGVFYRKDIERYTAQIRFNGKLKYIGCFIDKKDAAIAYNKVAKELFGEYANLNIL